jgi:hypothetical protein
VNQRNDVGTSGKVTKQDIENKFREVQSDLTSAAEGAKDKAIVAGVFVLVLLVFLSYLMGRRSGKKKSTIVEIRRL